MGGVRLALGRVVMFVYAFFFIAGSYLFWERYRSVSRGFREVGEFSG